MGDIRMTARERSAATPVSVVIPCFRCSLTIGRAVSSILQQTRPPREVILVDDASGDGTLDVLRSLEMQAPHLIRVMEMPVNGGAAAARNAGWEQGTQEFVAFLDADDAWTPAKLERQLALMMSEPDVVLSGHAIGSEPRGGDEGFTAIPNFTEVSKAAILIGNRFSTSSVVIRRDIPYRFDGGKRRSEDYHLWARLVLSGARAVALPETLGYRFKSVYGEAGLSADLWRMEKAEIDTYRKLHSERLVSTGFLPILVLWSAAKFVGRMGVCSWQNIRQQRRATSS